MAQRIKHLAGAAYALLAVVALTFGASTALRANETCGDDPGEIGTCPPFTEYGCNAECTVRYGFGGSCDPFACCTCLL